MLRMGYALRLLPCWGEWYGAHNDVDKGGPQAGI
jgi:hypothetical protein